MDDGWEGGTKYTLKHLRQHNQPITTHTYIHIIVYIILCHKEGERERGREGEREREIERERGREGEREREGDTCIRKVKH